MVPYPSDRSRSVPFATCPKPVVFLLRSSVMVGSRPAAAGRIVSRRRTIGSASGRTIEGVDLGGPAMTRIAKDYGYTLAELRNL